MKQQQHTIALIGCGNVARNWHLPAYKVMDNIAVVAVCDIDKELARKVAKEFNVGRFYSDAERMIDETKPEIVAIALPPFLHKEYLEKTLRGGSHVIVEKPLAPSWDEVAEIVSISQKYDRKVIVDQNWRHSKIARSTKRIIDEGLVGEPYYIEMAQYGYGYRGFVKTYVGKGKLAVTYEMGPHIVDMIRYWFGSEAEYVYACMPSLSHIDHPADWLVVAIINFPDNKIASITDDWGFRGEDLGSLLRGRINGSKGTISFEFKANGYNTLELCSEDKKGVSRYDVVEKNWPWNVNVPLTQHFIDSIERDKEPETSIKDNCGTMAIIFAAYESQEKKRRVEVKHIQ